MLLACLVRAASVLRAGQREFGALETVLQSACPVCKACHANGGYDRRAIHSSGLLILNRNAKLPCHLAFCFAHLRVQLCIAHKGPDAAFVVVGRGRRCPCCVLFVGGT